MSVCTDEKYCYELIQAYYKGKRAKRSGVPYMRHIDEGISVLKARDASSCVIAAYSIHPLLQDDAEVLVNVEKVRLVSNRILVLAMEYRNVANRGLSCYQIDNPASIYLGPFKEVHEMLVADKVQNYKDFLIYHLGKHEKSSELDRYFRNWLRALDVTDAEYARLTAAIDADSQKSQFVALRRATVELVDSVEEVKDWDGQFGVGMALDNVYNVLGLNSDGEKHE